MSNFDVQYNFIAIDKFSKVAQKVQKEVAKIEKLMNKGSKAFEKQSVSLNKTSTHVEKAAKKLNTLGNVTTDVAKKTNIGMKSIVKGLNKGGRSFSEITERVAKFGDSMAFKGYIQFMNIGLPIMLAGKMGLTYADQVEGAKLQMDAMFGKQKNYAAMSQQINVQAAQLSKHSRFTKAEIIATSAHIGVMTKNLKLAKDLTPLSLQYAALEQIDPSQASDKLLAAIRGGGAVAGTGMVLPKGVGSAMAAKRFLMLQNQLGGQLKGILGKDADTASASLHKMMGELQKTAGAMLISATPALHTLGKALKDTIDPLVSFMNAHTTLTGDFVKGALLAMTFTTGITLLGAAVSAIAMPFEILITVVKGLRTAYLMAAAASAVLSRANAKTAASSVADAASETAAGSIIKRGAVGALVGASALGVGAALAYGVYKIAQVRKAQYTSEAQRLAFVRSHGYGGKTGRKAVLAYAMEKSEEGGMGGAGMTIPGLAGSTTSLSPVQHKIDMEIKVSQEGKVIGVHANPISPSQFLMNVALGTNMGHAHG